MENHEIEGKSTEHWILFTFIRISLWWPAENSIERIILKEDKAGYYWTNRRYKTNLISGQEAVGLDNSRQIVEIQYSGLLKCVRERDGRELFMSN